VLTQPEIDGSTTLVHGPIKITPPSPDGNVGLVDTLGLPYGMGEPHPALLKLRGETLNPAQYGRVGKLNPALGHHLDQVPIVQLVAHAPLNAQGNDLAVEVPVLE